LHTQNGQTDTQLAADQLAGDKSVGALISNYQQGKPLVLLVDDKYSLFPFDLAATGVTYAVLGFYKIIHTWGMFLVTLQVLFFELRIYPQLSFKAHIMTEVELSDISFASSGAKTKAVLGGFLNIRTPRQVRMSIVPLFHLY
jgi:hypothetical protein